MACGAALGVAGLAVALGAGLAAKRDRLCEGLRRIGFEVLPSRGTYFVTADFAPLGFAGDGRDTASAVLYLASDEARFVTGTEIVVDGGMSVRCG